MATAISQFRKKVFPHVKGCPFPKIDEAVLDAAIEFCEDTNILRKGFNVDDATAADPGDEFDFYEFDFLFGGDSSASGIITLDLTDYFTGYDPIEVMWFKMNGQSYGLYSMDRPVNYTSIDDFKTVGPYKLFQFESATSLIIYPFDVNDTHDFFIQLSVKPQQTATTLDDILYRDWERAITPLAIANLQEIPDEEWSSESLASANRSRYQGEMGRAKIRISNGFVQGDSKVMGNFF